jgi:hypothetical protein
VAYGFDTKFDTSDADVIARRLGRCSAEAYNAVRTANRKNAGDLRDLIRAQMPVAGGPARNRHPESKAWEYAGRPRKSGTKPGAMKMSVRSGGSGDSSWVKGGNARTPHYFVNEFGGAVRWYKSVSTRSSPAHVIPVRAESATIASLGWRDSSGSRRGKAGWFFYPTARKHAPAIELATIRDAEQAVRLALSTR